jgi:ankyrin repeat protein
MDYKLKYIKYKQKYIALKEQSNFVQSDSFKNKYIALKNQYGGTRIDELITKLQAAPKFESYCDLFGFKQFQNECWNDSLLMPLCFSDALKDIIQPKLMKLNGKEIIELAFLCDRSFMMYPNYKTIRNLYENFPSYIDTIKKRFNRLYITKDTHSTRPTDKDSSICSQYGLHMFLHHGQKLKKLGAENYDIVLLIRALSFAFLEEESYINYYYHYVNNELDKVIPIDKIRPFSVIINLNTKNESGNSVMGHVVSFILCGGKYYIYDNETGLKQFRWDIYLNKIYKESYKPIILLPKINFGLTKDLKYYELNDINLIEKSEDQINKKMTINNFIFLNIKNGRDNFINDSKEFFIYTSIIYNDYELFVSYIDSSYINKDTLFAENNNLYHLLVYFNNNNKEFYNCLESIGTNINLQNIELYTPINYAVINENLNSVNLLKLITDLNFNIPDNIGNTPLYNSIDLLNIDIVRSLLTCDIDINVPGNDNTSPFHLAMYKKKLDIGQLLLERGANLEIKDKDGNTVLLDIIKNINTDNDYIDIANYLIDIGADINIKTKNNGTLLLILVIIYKSNPNPRLYNLIKKIYQKNKSLKDIENIDKLCAISYANSKNIINLISLFNS